MATNTTKLDLSTPWDDEESSTQLSAAQPQLSAAQPELSAAAPELSAAAPELSAAAQGLGDDTEASYTGSTSQFSQLRPSAHGLPGTQTNPSPSITLAPDPYDHDHHDDPGDSSDHGLDGRGEPEDEPGSLPPSQSFLGADDSEISAKSLIIARPKHPLLDRMLPTLIYLGFFSLLTGMFTAGLEVSTWQQVVAFFGSDRAKNFETFIDPPPLASDAAKLRQKLPAPEVMANPYHFLPTTTAADQWLIADGDSEALFGLLSRYEASDSLGRYQLLRRLRAQPSRSAAPIFSRALSEKKLWLVMEAVLGLIACGEPLQVFELERRLEGVSPALFGRYLKRLEPKTRPVARVWLRTMIKADLPWLRPMLLSKLTGSKSTSSKSTGSKLDRLFRAAARFDKSGEVRRWVRRQPRDAAADKAYQKVWYRDLARLGQGPAAQD